MTGAPVVAVLQPTPANFSSPLVAIPFDRSAWSDARMFTQKYPARRISGEARDVFAGLNMINGGSSETEENDWQVMPTGWPSETDVTTVTPLQDRPSTSRNWRARAAASGSSGIGVCSPRRSSKSSSLPSQDW